MSINEIAQYLALAFGAYAFVVLTLIYVAGSCAPRFPKVRK